MSQHFAKMIAGR